MRIPLLALAALACAALPAAASAKRPSPESELARVTEGRVEGEPTTCINNLRFTSTRIIDGTAIVYESGNTVWVNRPRGGARGLDRWDVLVTRQYSNQLCSGDVVRLYDTSAQMETGAVFLGEFVPYRRAR
jgi:hypothetical protein